MQPSIWRFSSAMTGMPTMRDRLGNRQAIMMVGIHNIAMFDSNHCLRLDTVPTFEHHLYVLSSWRGTPEPQMDWPGRTLRKCLHPPMNSCSASWSTLRRSIVVDASADADASMSELSPANSDGQVRILRPEMCLQKKALPIGHMRVHLALDHRQGSEGEP